VEGGARFLEVGARDAEGVDWANTIVKLAEKSCQGVIRTAGVLHEDLAPDVGVDGLLQIGEVGDSRRERFHHTGVSRAFVPGIRACERGDVKLECYLTLIVIIGRVASTSKMCRGHFIGRGGHDASSRGMWCGHAVGWGEGQQLAKGSSFPLVCRKSDIILIVVTGRVASTSGKCCGHVIRRGGRDASSRANRFVRKRGSCTV
jgi:hypothetical protein